MTVPWTSDFGSEYQRFSTPPMPSSRPDPVSARPRSSSSSRARQLLDFLLHNKKWWLIPFVGLLLVAAALILFGGAGTAPFMYSH